MLQIYQIAEARAGGEIDHSAHVVQEEVAIVHKSQLSKDPVSLPSTSGSPGTSEQQSKKDLTRKRNKRRTSESATNIDTAASILPPAGSVSGSHQLKEVPSTKEETPSSLTPVIGKKGRGRPRRIVDSADAPQELAAKVHSLLPPSKGHPLSTIFSLLFCDAKICEVGDGRRTYGNSWLPLLEEWQM